MILAMPKGSGGGRRKNTFPDSLRAAFLAQHGIKGKVQKVIYLGKDKNGFSIYKFVYQQWAAFLASPMTVVKTMGVRRDGKQWIFGDPNSAALKAAIPGEVDFRAEGPNPLVDLAAVKIGELVSRGILSQEDAQTLIKNLPTMSDSSLRTLINRGGAFAQQPAVVEGDAEALNLDDLFAGLDLGGGGFAGPVYRAPDRRVVEDFVKGTLVSLVGTVPDHLVGPGVDAYMRDHRRNFDSEAIEIDPGQSVLELIRNTAEYQSIHKLRPKSVDERDWIGQRAQEAQRGGLDTEQIEKFAITQATAGGDLPDVAEAAATAQLQESGQAPTLLEQQFRQVAQDMFSGLVR
jgi:hypothetical protein